MVPVVGHLTAGVGIDGIVLQPNGVAVGKWVMLLAALSIWMKK